MLLVGQAKMFSKMLNIQIGEETRKRKNIFGFLLFGLTYSPVLEISNNISRCSAYVSSRTFKGKKTGTNRNIFEEIQSITVKIR